MDYAAVEITGLVRTGEPVGCDAMNMSCLNDQQIEYLWSAAPHEPDWKREMRERLRLIAGNCGVPLGQWLRGTRAIREVTV
ncbi:hypothetical protein JTM54_36450, partial [Pseudomonas aeruginosa]|nr:hypothetical protein [Pseudomonas aeruginosa]